MKTAEIFEELKSVVLMSLSDSDDLSGEGLYSVIDEALLKKTRECRLSLSERLKLREMLFNSFKKLDVLQELLDDDRVTEIMINGPDDIFIERNNRIIRWDGKFESEERLEQIIQLIVSRVNRRVNTGSPIVDARLKDGSR
ncbi:MAG: ATPase, T2SS/T4P/T4SS family, partial [Eubacteriales bacterium]|nr:ATPase, T2SS/T4P/T4SS family [Eubacteriales bacterium]